MTLGNNLHPHILRSHRANERNIRVAITGSSVLPIDIATADTHDVVFDEICQAIYLNTKSDAREYAK